MSYVLFGLLLLLGRFRCGFELSGHVENSASEYTTAMYPHRVLDPVNEYRALNRFYLEQK